MPKIIVVALFTRAWIEIHLKRLKQYFIKVALFTRAWIEIVKEYGKNILFVVALFTRAWIEIRLSHISAHKYTRRPLYEGVD